LDGGYHHIPETGEVIEPHPNFRLFVTANSAGSGDHTGQYAGSVRRLDPAFLDRFIFLKSTYMPKADEADMFSLRYPNLSCEFITKMVELANETRGKATDPSDPLNLPFSTRSLDRSFRLMQSFGIGTMSAEVKADDLLPVIKPAYFDRLSPYEEEAAKTLLRMHFA
jgi:cobaltochelatase CobS